MPLVESRNQIEYSSGLWIRPCFRLIVTPIERADQSGGGRAAGFQRFFSKADPMTPGLAKQISGGSIAGRALPLLVERAIHSTGSGDFLTQTLQQLVAESGLQSLAVAVGRKGTWETETLAGKPLDRLPEELLHRVLDEEQMGVEGAWLAAPLLAPPEDGRLLVGRGDLPQSEFGGLAAAVGMLLRWQSLLLGQTRRAERLRAVLEATVRWRQADQTDDLLKQIAETSTRLLKAERATIFLIDPVRNLLVGRPALGVEGGELLIPVDGGVVGQVIRQRESRRVDRNIASEQAMVNRDVDRQLKFETHSLLCVPMTNSRNQVIGAFELINKRDGNFSDADEQDLVELALHASAAIESSRHVEKLNQSRRMVADQAASQVAWIGQSPAMERIRQTIARVADTGLALLITGENGTGKEVVAQTTHYLSSRRDQPLVAVNCAAITETLLESELFGHEKGAFTDAHQTRPGKFELASQGTLFLDEIGDMSLSGQAKLLRVLEEKVVVRVGGSTPIPTAARIVAATNQDLAALVREKKFREDLFFRLNVLVIELPPLRARGEDILLLADHFLAHFAVKVRRPVPHLTAAARKRLLAHDWPGNVRELRNMMERIAYLSNEEQIDAENLPFINAPRPQREDAIDDSLPLAEATDRFQSEYIRRQIRATGGNMSIAAERMGLHRSNLYRKMRQLGMEPGADGPGS